MRINTKVVLLIKTGAVISRESYEYQGPIAQAFTIGKTSSNSKQQSTSKNESGTEFNEDFLNKAFAYASMAKPGKYKVKTGTGGTAAVSPSGAFDAEAYLRANPDVAKFKDGPYEHYIRHGKAEGRDPGGNTTTGIPSFAGGEEGQDLEFDIPGYDPTYVRGNYTGAEYAPGAYTEGKYTGANYTPVHGGDFDALEKNLFDSQGAKVNKAYSDAVARQREELSQSGGLNDAAQYLEGSTRSSLDRSYLDSLQQAARDTSTTVLGLKRDEAARRTGFDVGEATRRTGYDVNEALRRTGFDVGEAGARTGFSERESGRRTGYDTSEAGRETAFNEETAARLLQLWLQKIGIIGEVGRYARGESISSGVSSAGGFNFGYAPKSGGGTVS